MRKIFKHKSAEAAVPAEQDVAALMSRMQQQLESLERKLDNLISQGSERPFQRFDRPRHHDRDRQSNNFRERSFTRVVCADCHQECEVPFKPSSDRPVYCKDCFAKHKDSGHSFKPEYGNRPQKRYFSESSHQQETGTQEFGKKKRGGFRRKERG